MAGSRKVFYKTFCGEPTFQSEKIRFLNFVGQDFQPATGRIESGSENQKKENTDQLFPIVSISSANNLRASSSSESRKASRFRGTEFRDGMPDILLLEETIEAPFSVFCRLDRDAPEEALENISAILICLFIVPVLVLSFLFSTVGAVAVVAVESAFAVVL